MKRRLFIAGAAVSAGVVVPAAEQHPSQQRILESTTKAIEWVEEAYGSFAMAYFLKPLDDRDKRPVFLDPFAKEGQKRQESVPVLRILRGEKSGAVDMANLLASARHRVKVPMEKVAALAQALLESDIEAPVADCYEPHHVVICYNDRGGITGVIEICLTCVDFRIYPGGKLLRTSFYDMAEVARILAALGLPLDDKNTSIEVYTKDIEEQIETLKKRKK